jgi:hypothetical protein
VRIRAHWLLTGWLSGVDPTLSRHVAHLFAHDPLVIFKEKVELDDERRTDHFESIQSTNWQSVRWKPPPPDSGARARRVHSCIRAAADTCMRTRAGRPTD